MLSAPALRQRYFSSGCLIVSCAKLTTCLGWIQTDSSSFSLANLCFFSALRGLMLKWNFSLQNMFDGSVESFQNSILNSSAEIAKAVMKFPPHTLLYIFKTSCASQVLDPRQSNSSTWLLSGTEAAHNHTLPSERNVSPGELWNLNGMMKSQG